MPKTFEFPNLGEIPERVIRRAMPEIVAAVEQIAKDEAPERSGKLRAKIHGVVLRGGLEGAVQATARHAHLVHDGTAGHGIAPKRAKHLRIPSSGRALFRQSAAHPGAKANPFLDRARDKSQGEVEGLLQVAAEVELQAVAG